MAEARGTIKFFLNGAERFTEFSKFREIDHQWGMNWLDFKILSLTCVLLAPGLHAGLYHKRWLSGRFEPFYCNDKFLSLNSLNSVKTFRKNSITDAHPSQSDFLLISCSFQKSHNIRLQHPHSGWYAPSSEEILNPPLYFPLPNSLHDNIQVTVIGVTLHEIGLN